MEKEIKEIDEEMKKEINIDGEALKQIFGEGNDDIKNIIEKRASKRKPFSDEKSPESQESLDEAKLLKKIEAALFLSASYLDIDDLVRVTGVNPLMTKELVEELVEKYNHAESAILIHKREVEGKPVFKMDVKEEFHNLVNKMVTGQTEFSKSEQETLAIIAYKQPIKQSSIVRIRSNKAYEHIHHFVAMGLVKAKRMGRTYELTLSEDFYNYFNVDKK